VRWESTIRCKSPRITVATRNRNSVVMIKAMPEPPNSKENEARGSGATCTGSPKGVFAERKPHKPRLALNNITTGACEPSEWSSGPSDIEGKATRLGASECGQRTSFNRSSRAHLDEIQGGMANTLNGACGSQRDIDGQAEGRVSGSERSLGSEWGRWLHLLVRDSARTREAAGVSADSSRSGVLLA
jgi:hypothetical protein